MTTDTPAAPITAEREAYKWAYEYLQSRMESIDRHGWAHDCDGEIEDRIKAAALRSTGDLSAEREQEISRIEDTIARGDMPAALVFTKMRYMLRAALSAPVAAQPAVAAPTKQGRALPNPGSPEASALLDSLLAEYSWPANSKNAARAGWEAANRWLAAAPAAQPADSAMEVLRELVDNNDNAPDNRDTAAVNAWLPRWHAAWRRARTLSAASNKESQHG